MNIFDLLDDTPPMIKPTRKRVPLTPPFNPGAKPQIPEIDLATLLASDDEAAKTQTRPRLVPPPREVAEEAIYIPDDVDESVNVSGGSGEPVTMPRPTLSPMQITPRPMEEEPRDPRSHVQLSPYDDINLSPLDYERKRLGKLTNLELNPVRNKEAQTIDPATGKPGKANFGGRLKDALREALIGAGQQVAANGGEANWGTLGAAAAGGIGGAIDPSMNEKRQREYDIAQSQGRVNELERQEAVDTANTYKQTQIENINKDNEFQSAKLKADQEAKLANQQQKAATDLFRGKTYSKKNPAHRKLAEAAGLDPDSIPDFDLSNPVVKTINGMTYEWDRAKGEWNPSGLPPSEKDKIVPLEITIPGGKTHLFNVPQGQAASVAAQLQAAGMQIEAASMRQDDQQRFQAGENAKSRAFTREQNAISNARQAAEAIEAIRKKGTELYKTDEEIEEMVQRFRKTLPKEIQQRLQ